MNPWEPADPDDRDAHRLAGDAAPRNLMSGQVRLHVIVRGHVQGVGFRDWVERTAVPLGLAGSADNRADGAVEIIAEGTREAAEQLLQALDGTTPGTVESVESNWTEPQGEVGFRTG